MISSIKDFTPTKEQISLHGLGFIQVALPANKRLHVWHPDLPRRRCFEHSAIHNHRFAFRSTVLVGRQMNQRCKVSPSDDGAHDLISHDGPRSEKGGRLSFVAGRCDALLSRLEWYEPGESYNMDELEYHHTPNNGVVVTLMEKHTEGVIHANSVITHGHEFDQSFDRFQLSADELWQYVVKALRT